MNKDTGLFDIEQKVYAGIRLDRNECIRLMESNDILALGRMANFVRKKKAMDYAYFTNNLNINPTNVCELRCDLCAFSRDEGEEGSYVMTLDDIENKIRNVRNKHKGLLEVHIVGGLIKKQPFEYYTGMLKRIKSIDPDIHIQAFTAVELEYFSRIYGMELREVITRLRDAGLGSVPGGGAEIFSERVRKQICPKKISGDTWLKVHEAIHKTGIHSNATMLYGHIETPEERIDHLLALRKLQDATNGFLAFVPLAFHPKNTALKLEMKGTTGFDDLKVLAVSRIVLDNFTHIKALWMYFGLKMTQVSLDFGVDDVGGISIEEKIVHAAGARTPEGVERDELVRTIEEAGRIPVEVDSIYGKRQVN